MRRVVLTHLDRPGRRALRTPEVKGLTANMPEVGESFRLIADALEGFGVRVVTTTEVTKVEQQESGDIVFNTKTGSTYKVSEYLSHDKN